MSVSAHFLRWPMRTMAAVWQGRVTLSIVSSHVVPLMMMAVVVFDPSELGQRNTHCEANVIETARKTAHALLVYTWLLLVLVWTGRYRYNERA